MGPVPRERHNAKARQSTAGSRKKGKMRKHSSPTDVDPNAAILVPKTAEERELDRKEKLRQELLEESNSKWNTKKKKRLEKYIEKKLKKEERVEILQKLSQTQAHIPDSLQLQSSSTLGTGRVSTHRERLDKLEDKDVRKALAGRSGKRKRNDNYEVSLAEEDSDGSESDVAMRRSSSRSKSPIASKDTHPVESTSSAVVGSALQRNPDGTAVAPRIRVNNQTAFRSWGSSKPIEEDPESDSSFDSSDSAYDSSDNDDASVGDSDNEEEETPSPPKRSLGFKDWATKQIQIAKGHEPTRSTPPPSLDPTIPQPPPTKKRKIELTEMRGPLGESISLPDTSLAQKLGKTKSISIKRPLEVEEARLLLPIVSEEQPIMEAILMNPVVIICGETGSGKTTQVPQFLYEAGFGTIDSENPGMIGVTQPRRVAAMSMATRVAHELSLTSSKVSYQIRYDATVSPSTSIKFMTDGVLLRELATDFVLSKYSIIIIDEAHERSMNTDILIGVLSRVLKLREQLWTEGKDGIKPLRLVIMSATLRVSDFAENKTLFSAPPPVINVAARQHPVTVHFNRRTASDYVAEAIKKATKIHTRLPPGGILIFLTGQNEIQGVCRKLEARFGERALIEKRKQRGSLEARLAILAEEALDVRTVGPAHADVEVEDLDLAELGVEFDDNDVPMHIVPLYSLLPSDKQMKVFQPPPAGSRLVVVSTNVAETSLTIPGIRYVIDCGRAKQRSYDVNSGIQSFQVNWVSKASAAQRAGRAGRTGPGHCYRLYSSALYEHYFAQFSQPEILQMPIEGVVLQMKAMHIDAVVNFPFPTPPERQTLQKAEKVLGWTSTDLGRAMSLFPLSPRFARMLVAGSTQVPAESFFKSQQTHSSLGKGASDSFRELSVVGAYEYAGSGLKFCAQHFVRPKAMEEIHKLRAQIHNIVRTNFPTIKTEFVPGLRPPNDLQLKVLRQLLTAGFIDQVAVRKDRVEKESGGTKYTSTKGVPYRALGVPEDVFIHPSSVVAGQSPPEYVVSTNASVGITIVNPAWLASLGKGSLCTFSKPVKNNVGVMMVVPRFGPEGWELPAVKADLVL
ncbi:P-loop containing nucleoside triphosphate hydrolase protein [Mucidula mucida]|nr:P-loop containing nucleoside triphosphate hydrolase protein [Mucidula mucida]